jgi:hypothetical protein
MTASHRAKACGATIAMMLLGAAAPLWAQTASHPQNRTAHQAAQKPAKRAAPAATDVGYWTANTSLPDEYRTKPGRAESRRQDAGVPTEITGELGRVPVQSGQGSIGFTSQSVNRAQFSDGRTVPGLDPNTQSPSSFVGMSLSVRSDNKAFPIPLPVYGRPE